MVTPLFYPLNVLVCGENLGTLEKELRSFGCQVTIQSDGAEALRCAMDIIFDVIFTDVKMAKIHGDNMAKMLRSTANPNCDTPIVGMLDESELDQSVFDVVEAKEHVPKKLSDILSKLCGWAPPPPAISTPKSLKLHKLATV